MHSKSVVFRSRSSPEAYIDCWVPGYRRRPFPPDEAEFLLFRFEKGPTPSTVSFNSFQSAICTSIMFSLPQKGYPMDPLGSHEHAQFGYQRIEPTCRPASSRFLHPTHRGLF